MIARTRRQVERLNAAIRQRMVDAGRLGELEVSAPDDGPRFAVGDRVVCLRNDGRLNVDNGTVATITDVDPHRGITVRPDGRDQHITLTPQYVADGHLDHGYAFTGHKAQGLTVDHVLVVADETAYRWQHLATQIAEARKIDYERRTLTHELNKLNEQRKTLAAYYIRDRARLDEVTSGPVTTHQVLPGRT